MDIKLKKYIAICIGIVILIGGVGVAYTYYTNRSSSVLYGFNKYNSFISNVEASQDLTVFPSCRMNALEPLKVASHGVPKDLDSSFLDYYKAVREYINKPNSDNKKEMNETLTKLTLPILDIYRIKHWDVQEINQNALTIALKYGYPKNVYNLIS